MESRASRKLTVAAAAAAILLITFGLRTFSILNVTTVGFVYLLIILLVAAWRGIVESVAASIVATVCLNYFFLPPVGTWAIEDPENWVALMAFLVTSLIASDLSNRARRRTVEANARKAEMERLYELSRTMLARDVEPVGDEIAKDLARICDIPAVMIYNSVSDSIHRGGVEELEGTEDVLKRMVATGSSTTDEQAGTVLAVIKLGDRITGSIALRGAELSNTALHALLNLIAITLESARGRDVVTRAQAARESEEFKSALLDGLAHEFKTPLTSIKAATSALLGSSVLDALQSKELLTVVDQESDRLIRLVTEATRLARLEAGKIQVNRVRQAVDLLIKSVLNQMEPQRDGRCVEVSIAPGLPDILADADLMQLALRQLVDNAFKYSPRKSSIRISAVLSGDKVVIAVRNSGEPLSESDRVRVFEKFYRGRTVRRQVAGTGMGLPVARDILLAHGGDLQLGSSNAEGTEFAMTIPLAPGL